MTEVRYQKVGAIDAGFLRDSEFRLAWWVLCLEEVLAWHQGIVLDSYTLKRDDVGWTLRVQGRRRTKGGQASCVVAWMHAASAFDTFRYFADVVRRNEVSWKTDKYPVFDKFDD